MADDYSGVTTDEPGGLSRPARTRIVVLCLVAVVVLLVLLWIVLITFVTGVAG
jgi:hypothetical protein